jgi:hypothetical protein
LILISIHEQQGTKTNFFKVTAHCYFTFYHMFDKNAHLRS